MTFPVLNSPLFGCGIIELVAQLNAPGTKNHLEGWGIEFRKTVSSGAMVLYSGYPMILESLSILSNNILLVNLNGDPCMGAMISGFNV